eukprot:3331972-Amphidinium_carterae.2
MASALARCGLEMRSRIAQHQPWIGLKTAHESLIHTTHGDNLELPRKCGILIASERCSHAVDSA